MAGNLEGTALHVGDLIVIVVYFVLVLFVGLWSARKNRGSAGGYFLAGRNMNWIPVGASLFASNLGSLHFVGLVGSGAANGISIGLYELNAMYVLMILGYIFLPVYIASGVFTMPDYLKCRLGGKRIQIYLAVLALLVYIFTKISADLYAGALFIEQALNWNIYWAILLLLAVAAIFTIAGGLTAVIWTDFIQTIIMMIGAVVLMVLAFIRVGGFNAMVEKYPLAVSNFSIYSNKSCGKPRSDYMNLFRDPVSADIPWPGLIGITINSIWYWCSDQVIVQRALAGKNYSHAKAGVILCSVIKILPLFILVFPGMIARILYTETVGCADPDICKAVCGTPTGCSNIAYPSLVIDLMPAGARGMMLAVMLSALMSSLTSIFNSSSTIFAMDIWVYIRKQASELELMIVGRLFVIVLVVISVIWVPVLKLSQGAELYVYIQEVSSFLQPPICCVFLLAVLWSRLNEQGAFWSLVVGMTLGILRFVVEYSYKVPHCFEDKPDPTPGFIKHWHYLYFSTFLFLVTGAVAIIVSLLTKPIEPQCTRRLTYWTRHSKAPRYDIDTKEMVPHLQHDKDVEMESFQDYKAHLPDEERNNLTTQFFDDKTAGSTKIVKDSNGFLDEKHTQIPLINGTNNPNGVVQSNDKNHCENIVEGSSNEMEDVAWYTKLFRWLCGMENIRETNVDKRKVQKFDMIPILETRRWKILSNTAAVFSMLSCIAIGVYFR